MPVDLPQPGHLRPLHFRIETLRAKCYLLQQMPKLDFDHLSDVEFEEFCFHLLDRLGFVNVDWRKGTAHETSPADSGRDIVCQQITEDIDQTKRLETWFVDCKHYKKGVPPGELQNLLTWAEAERPEVAIFIVSGFLSNPAKEYLEKYERNRKPPFRIKYWERPKLEKLTIGKRALLMDFGLLPQRTRRIPEILKAEGEFFDRVWYDRHQVLRHLERGGKRKTASDIMKAAQKEATQLEKKYGKKNLGPYSDFDWGIVNGKLSALRWVLGEEWDMLDT